MQPLENNLGPKEDNSLHILGCFTDLFQGQTILGYFNTRHPYGMISAREWENTNMF